MLDKRKTDEKGEELKKIYKNRFYEELALRNKIYRVLCSYFFQKYIPKDAVVLDLAAGFCEFINNIKAKEKIALDRNPDVKKFAKEDVKAIISSSASIREIKKDSVDVVFVSNLFEHLTRGEIVKTLKEVNRILKEGGRLLILQPNIRYCYKDYWMFFDHITPLDDRSLVEVLKMNNFKILECKAKFLPYTTKSRLSNFPLLFLKMYLSAPLLSKIGQSLMGKQAFVYARKCYP